MTRRDSIEHLAQARQFLAAARLSLDSDLWDAAASSAVLAGIRATDAIRATRLGSYARIKTHADAVTAVRQAGNEGKKAATLLSRLLAIKNKAQYDTTRVTPDAARRTIDAASKLLELARQVQAG